MGTITFFPEYEIDTVLMKVGGLNKGCPSKYGGIWA